AGHAARTGQQAQIGSEVVSDLPERGRMEIQPGLRHQLTEVDVNRTSETVPDRKSLLLHALDVPESVRDVLEIKSNTTLEQVWPFSTPVSQKMAVWPLTRLMTIRSAQCFLILRLGMRWSGTSQNQQADKEDSANSQHANRQVSIARTTHSQSRRRSENYLPLRLRPRPRGA